MKLAWKILVGFGALLVVLSFGIDTTVSYGGGRVQNFGLQHVSQSLLILGCFMCLAGIVLYAVKKLRQTPDQDSADKAADDAARDKVEQEVKAWGTEVSQAGRDLEDIWASTWERSAGFM